MKKITSILFIVVMGLTFFAGCTAKDDGAAKADEKIEIRFSWWGSESRHEATLAAIELYEAQNPNVDIIPEYSGYDGYNNKLMAQIAGKNAPDIFTCTANWSPAIYEANGYYDLTGKTDSSGHSPAILESCTIDGVQFGVNLGIGGYGFVYNKSLFEEIGVEVPEGDYTWDDFFVLLADIYEKSNGETYGIPDMRCLNVGDLMEVYGRTALAKDAPYMFNETDITMTAEDVVAFMTVMSELPEGSMLPPAESVTIDQFTMAPTSSRRVGLEPTSIPVFDSFQSQTDDELALLQYPVGPNGETANVASPGMLFSVAQNSKHPEEAIRFIEFMTNDTEAAKVLKNSRGVLPTEAQREAVLSEEGLLSSSDMVLIDMINKIYSTELIPYIVGPMGSSGIKGGAAANIGQSVAFGELAIEDSGEEFIKQAKLALDQ